MAKIPSSKEELVQSLEKAGRVITSKDGKVRVSGVFVADEVKSG